MTSTSFQPPGGPHPQLDGGPHRLALDARQRDRGDLLVVGVQEVEPVGPGHAACCPPRRAVRRRRWPRSAGPRRRPRRPRQGARRQRRAGPAIRSSGLHRLRRPPALAPVCDVSSPPGPAPCGPDEGRRNPSGPGPGRSRFHLDNRAGSSGFLADCPGRGRRWRCRGLAAQDPGRRRAEPGATWRVERHARSASSLSSSCGARWQSGCTTVARTTSAGSFATRRRGDRRLGRRLCCPG